MRLYRYMAPVGAACGLMAALALRTSFRRTVVVNSTGPTIMVNSPLDQGGRIPNARPTIEMAFVLDTTGSMGGLIDAAKQKVWSIINRVMQCPRSSKSESGSRCLQGSRRCLCDARFANDG